MSNLEYHVKRWIRAQKVGITAKTSNKGRKCRRIRVENVGRCGVHRIRTESVQSVGLWRKV